MSKFSSYTFTPFHWHVHQHYTSKFLQELKFSPNGDEDFMVEKRETHAYPLTWKVAFKAWILKDINFSPRVCYHIVQHLFKEFECLMEEESWIPSHIIQLCNSCISWNVPNSTTWWIFSNTVGSWIKKKHIHHPLEAKLPDSLIHENLSRRVLENRSHDQVCKIKLRDHSFWHVSKIVRKVNAHIWAQ